MLEKALTFEQTASLTRTPSTLDDQSIAYQYIMYSKGALVFKLLRDTLGEQKFNQLMRTFLEKYRDKNASIYDFEKLASQVAGENMRYFFARWVEGTGVPEFSGRLSDYPHARRKIYHARNGQGKLRQSASSGRGSASCRRRRRTRKNNGSMSKIRARISTSNRTANRSTSSLIPNFKLLRISDDLRISSIARRGIEQFKEGNYPEAQQQFEAALKLDRSNAWIYYHLGLALSRTAQLRSGD